MIIKAGTYRFNDELTDPGQVSASINFTVDFTDSYFGGDGSNIIHGVCSNLSYNGSTGDLGYTFVSTVPDLSSYGATYPLELWMHGGGGWADELCKTITVTQDTTFTDTNGVAFATWFTSNTTMLIKAGTYRFNDDLDLIVESGNITLSANLPFTVFPDFSVIDNTVVFGSGSVPFNGITVTRTNSGTGSTVSFIDTNLTELPIYVQAYVQLGAVGWAGILFSVAQQYPDVSQESATALYGWGQIITITTDQYVPTNFGLWAVANWQPQSEPTPTENITITITYKGSPIITITNGVMLNAEGEEVTKAIIPTESYKLDSNIELTITKS